MRRITALVLALALVFCCTCAVADTISAGGKFSVTYPGGWSVDTSGTSQNSSTYQWMFAIYHDDLHICIEVYASYSAGLADFSMTGASEQELAAYRDNAVNEYTQSAGYAEYVDTLYAGGTVPIQMYYIVHGKVGPYYLAETMENGWAYMFMAYNHHDYDAKLTSSQLSAVRSIVNSFVFE